MADLIYRKNATKLINELLEDIHRGKTELHKQILEQLAINITCLPPADTERHAHWTRINDVLSQCSNCKTTILRCDTDNYCSNCGCKMDEVTK